MKRTSTCVLLCGLLAASAGADQPLERVHHRQIHMGMQVAITVYAPDRLTGDEACRAAFARIAALDAMMSDYRPDSELNRLCAQAGGPPVPVSPELLTVLQRALLISERSGGAFDVTVGPYVRLWREWRKTGQEPSEAEWRAAGELVGWQQVRLDPAARTVQLLLPGMELDLGGIAKGYALDEALAVLRARGLPRALVAAGGDIAVGDPPPGREGWRVEVAYAEPGRRRLLVSNVGVSTSGDTEQFVEVDGRRCSHIIDPRSGPRFGEPLVATIVAPDATTSDGLATAAVVLGQERALALVASFSGVTAYVRVADQPALEPVSPQP